MLRLQKVTNNIIQSTSCRFVKNYSSTTSTPPSQKPTLEDKLNKPRILKKKGQFGSITINPKELPVVEPIKEKIFEKSKEIPNSERLSNYYSYDENKTLLNNQDYFYSQNYLKLGTLTNLSDLPEDWAEFNFKSKSKSKSKGKSNLKMEDLDIPTQTKIEISNSTANQTPFPRLSGNSPTFVAIPSFMGNSYLRGMINNRKLLNVLDESSLEIMEKFIRAQILNDAIRVFSIHTTSPGVVHSAGIDFKEIYEQRESNGGIVNHEYFKKLSKLFYLISCIPKPFISFQDGLTIGAGCAFSSNSGFRVATENSIYSIPDCSIGFFPNAGNLRFLARLPDGMGRYLALTGRRLRGPELIQSGISNFYMHTNEIKYLDEALSIPFNHIDRLLLKMSTCTSNWEMDCDDEETHVQKYSLAIKRCFHEKSTIEQVLEALNREISEQPENKDWAQRCINNINKSSPISIKLTMRLFQLVETENLPVNKYFERDYRITMALLNDDNSDAWEGIKCSIISPSTPKWKYSGLSQVTDSMIDEIINYQPPKEQKLQLRNIKPSNLYFEGVVEQYLDRHERVLSEEDKKLLRNSFSAPSYKDPLPDKYYQALSIHYNKAQSVLYDELEFSQEVFTTYLREGKEI